MIGRFTETKQLEDIRAHLMHGRLVYAFTGTSFMIMHYNFNEEKGIVKDYNILDNMALASKEYNLMELTNVVKSNIENSNYHYMLYFGELHIDDSIYYFMKEFYNPSEELPVVVATAMVDSECIRADISHCSNISGKVIECIDNFNSSLMENYAGMDLSAQSDGTYSVFSIWLSKCTDKFQLNFRSKYLGFIDEDKELCNFKQSILDELNMELQRLGIA